MIIEVIIEIPKGSMNKYEVCKETGRIRLDRVLFSAVVYPENYGYLEHTLAEDNDPLDVFVISTLPVIPGCIVEARLIGGIEMYDDGEQDTKLIAVVARDPRFDHIKNLKNLGEHKLKEIKEFLKTYKNLQNKQVVVKDFFNKQQAIAILKKSQQNYINTKK